MTASVDLEMDEVRYAAGSPRAVLRPIPIECPIAIEVNGIAYAVMMGSPADLEDYAIGFALAEGMITAAGDVLDLSIAEIDAGVIIRLSLSERHAAPLLERVRIRVSEGSCGLCGLESITEVLRPLPQLPKAPPIAPTAIERALLGLSEHQPHGARTGAMHAAAYCDREGAIRLAREDVGRHNALDKLIGALSRAQIDPSGGFMLVTARCSYELVEKTVRAGCPTLVAISAPTSLAIERAYSAGLTLVALARRDTMLVANPPTRASTAREVAA